MKSRDLIILRIFLLLPPMLMGDVNYYFLSQKRKKKAFKIFIGTECLELLSFVSDFILEEVCQFAFL